MIGHRRMMFLLRKSIYAKSSENDETLRCVWSVWRMVLQASSGSPHDDVVSTEMCARRTQSLSGPSTMVCNVRTSTYCNVMIYLDRMYMTVPFCDVCVFYIDSDLSAGRLHTLDNCFYPKPSSLHWISLRLPADRRNSF